jgi:hypothetical protein
MQQLRLTQPTHTHTPQQKAMEATTREREGIKKGTNGRGGAHRSEKRSLTSQNRRRRREKDHRRREARRERRHSMLSHRVAPGEVLVQLGVDCVMSSPEISTAIARHLEQTGDPMRATHTRRALSPLSSAPTHSPVHSPVHSPHASPHRDQRRRDSPRKHQRRRKRHQVSAASSEQQQQQQQSHKQQSGIAHQKKRKSLLRRRRSVQDRLPVHGGQSTQGEGQCAAERHRSSRANYRDRIGDAGERPHTSRAPRSADQQDAACTTIRSPHSAERLRTVCGSHSEKSTAKGSKDKSRDQHPGTPTSARRPGTPVAQASAQPRAIVAVKEKGERKSGTKKKGGLKRMLRVGLGLRMQCDLPFWFGYEDAAHLHLLCRSYQTMLIDEVAALSKHENQLPPWVHRAFPGAVLRRPLRYSKAGTLTSLDLVKLYVCVLALERVNEGGREGGREGGSERVSASLREWMRTSVSECECVHE